MEINILILARNGQNDAIELMNTNGALKQHINDRDKGIGYTALVFALLKEHVETVAILLEYGADPNSVDVYGKPPLSLLADPQPLKNPSAEKRLEIARLLIDRGANVNLVDKDQGTPLWYAVFSATKGIEDRLPFVKLLLENGADSNLKCKGQSPIDIAKRSGWQPLIDLLETYS